MSNNNSQHQFVKSKNQDNDTCQYHSYTMRNKICGKGEWHKIHAVCTCLTVGIEYCPIHRSTIICGKTDCIRPTGHTGDCWPVPPAKTTPILDSVAEIEATRKSSVTGTLREADEGNHWGRITAKLCSKLAGDFHCTNIENHAGSCHPVERKRSGHPQLLPSAIGMYNGLDPLAGKSHIKVVYAQQRFYNSWQHDSIGQPLHSIQHFACTVTVIQVVGKAALPQVAGVFFGLNCFAQGDTLAKQIAEVSGLEIVKEYPTVD